MNLAHRIFRHLTEKHDCKVYLDQEQMHQSTIYARVRNYRIDYVMMLI